MCRKFQVIGAALAGCGLGLLVSGFFESEFFCGFVGVATLAVGIAVMQKK